MAGHVFEMRNTHFRRFFQDAQPALREAHSLIKISSMKTGERIRKIRQARKLTLAEVEQRAGLPDGNLSRIERGKQWVSEDKLFALASALEVNPAEFFAPNGNNFQPGPDTEGRLPRISWVQAGQWSDIVDNFQPGDAEEWLPIPFRHGPNAFILRVVGKSMYDPDGEKSYDDGDYIAVDPSREAQNKSMVIVRLEDENAATFKQLVVEPNGKKYLVALNPSWPNRIIEVHQDATICGVVIGKWVPE
jgi:SOS-response transcriptional repressor LexA